MPVIGEEVCVCSSGLRARGFRGVPGGHPCWRQSVEARCGTDSGTRAHSEEPGRARESLALSFSLSFCLSLANALVRST